MRNISKKSKFIVVGVTAATLALSGVAYAYWSTGGAGSGTATTGTTSDNLTITASGWAAMTPGTPANVNVTVTNPNTYAVHVNQVVLDTTFGGGTGVTTDNAGCLSSWFSVSGSPLTVNQNVAASGNTGSLAFGTITLSDLLATDQNACKSPTQVTIHFTSN